MSHRPIVLYGYEAIVPSDMELPQIISMVYEINQDISEPFQVKSILPQFPVVFDDSQITYEMVQFIIGFTPTSAKETYERSKELLAYLDESQLFNNIAIITNSPGFFCGIEWRPEVESEPSSESEYMSSSESEPEPEPESDDDSILSHSPVFPKYFS